MVIKCLIIANNEIIGENNLYINILIFLTVFTTRCRIGLQDFYDLLLIHNIIYLI